MHSQCSMTPFDLAQRYIGIKEIPGEADHPLIRWWHSLTYTGETDDEVPWCSSFVNGVTWELRLPRSKSARARSWLNVGMQVDGIDDAVIGRDVVILSRGNSPTAGHVGFYAGADANDVRLLGGNQGNKVSIAPYSRHRILGIRRL
jgi:uncharacterized protein (TIGR02594 family)